MRPEPIYVWPWNFGDMTKHKMKEGARFSCKVFGLSRSRHLVYIYIYIYVCVYIYIFVHYRWLYIWCDEEREISYRCRFQSCDMRWPVHISIPKCGKVNPPIVLGGCTHMGDGSVLHTVVTSDLVDIASGYWTLNEDDVWSYFILFVCLIYPGMQADRGM